MRWKKQLYAYLYAMTVIDFDAETVAPEGSADGRAEATEVLSRASFDLLVNDGTAALLKRPLPTPRPSRSAPRSAICSASTTRLPGSLPTSTPPSPSCAARACPPGPRPSARTISACSRRIWKKLIAARRAQARYFAPDRDPYEVLLDRYEKGLTIAQCDEFFSTLRETIVPLLADIQTRGKAVRTDFLDQEWPIDAQRRVSKRSWSCGP